MRRRSRLERDCGAGSRRAALHPRGRGLPAARVPDWAPTDGGPSWLGALLEARGPEIGTARMHRATRPGDLAPEARGRRGSEPSERALDFDVVQHDATPLVSPARVSEALSRSGRKRYRSVSIRHLCRARAAVKGRASVHENVIICLAADSIQSERFDPLCAHLPSRDTKL